MKTEIKFFLSWAHDDERLKRDLLGRLRTRFKILRNYNVSWWEDSVITPGEEWEPEILTRLGESDYIVQLLSPSFLASDFVRAHEVPGVGDAPNKPTLPLMLRSVPLRDDFELLGIEKRQIYRMQRSDGQGHYAYGDLSSSVQKDRFAREFVEGVVDRLSDRGGYR
ncbi:toll/interleukin-1 receptor domain-containing protein [Actinomyces sp. 565]|uniref:TIR domain-containing protein n=1 Tax=Actinomyces sp. 565 TaxID=2057794 RepID=UPI0013A6C911|nr:toll/interleukin-1 receptor domain-containing protein [Actinomyces sp. 565]